MRGPRAGSLGRCGDGWRSAPWNSKTAALSWTYSRQRTCPMSAEASCPVCGRAGGPNVPGATCGQCGWPWYLPPRAGPVTVDQRREFDTRLQAAQRDLEEREARALDAAMRDLLRNLPPASASSVIDISPAGVPLTTAYLDAAGTPQVRDGV